MKISFKWVRCHNRDDSENSTSSDKLSNKQTVIRWFTTLGQVYEWLSALVRDVSRSRKEIRRLS